MRKYILTCFLALEALAASAQELYTARGYWEETNKEAYKKIRDKQSRGDSLTVNEKSYLADYETYLNNYYQRMPPQERETYERMKPQWDQERVPAPIAASGDFDWRRPATLTNGFYGMLYGLGVAGTFDMNDAWYAAAPLLMSGAWMLGPAINEKKYEGIDQSVIQAANHGRFFGGLYGAAFGLALGGNTDNAGRWAAGLATAGSIGFGEMAFKHQKRQPYSMGKINLMSHYGIITPWLTSALLIAAESADPQAYGAAVFAGGLVGMIIGAKVADKYSYTLGDVDVISSLSVIITGIGFTTVIAAIENSSQGDAALILIPASSTLVGTFWGQKMVKGVRLTTRQGNTINLTSAGAATVALGILALAEVDSPTAWVAVPTVFGLAAHQILFSKFKKANLDSGVSGSLGRKNPVSFSVKITPESYFINRKIPAERFTPEAYTQMVNPLARIWLTF